MRLVDAALAVVAVVLAAGCGGGDESGAAASSSLEGVPWVVTAGIDVEGWEAAGPSASFEEGRVTGSAGCNEYGGPYTVDGSGLEIGRLIMTLIGCQDVAGDVETEFLAALEGVTGWRIEDEELALLDADDGELLRFEAATPVGSWVTTDWPTTLIPGTRRTATFTSDGRLGGSTGCNDYEATYRFDRGAIEVTELSVTERVCRKPALIMEQEADFLEALESATRYSVHHGTLHLFSADGALLAMPGTR